MIYKEEKILFPMALETLNEAEWARVKGGEEELGYAWITPGSGWKPSEEAAREAVEVPAYSRPGLKIKLDTGMLSEVQLNRILKCLPVDISFVDESDTVLYYSQTADRIFPRSPGVIGRKVQNCHPPESVHIVNRILQAFRAGERDVAEFWINLKGRLIHIRYLAVRDDQGQYLGCLEVSQDVTAIRGLQGEKRLLDWE
jgi:PAS domain S-box-containing protein